MFTGIKDQSISVSLGTSEKDGGCNSCNSYITEHGHVPHRVWIIYVQWASIRLCDECKKGMVNAIIHLDKLA